MPMTEDDIRDLATEQSYERGEEYYYDHSIIGIQFHGRLYCCRINRRNGMAFDKT